MENENMMIDGVTGEVIEEVNTGDFKRGLIAGAGIAAVIGLGVFVAKKIIAKKKAKAEAEAEYQCESENSSCQNEDVE